MSRKNDQIVPDQTIGALLRRLHEAGFDSGDLERARAAHDLAIELFAGSYRGNGRPFVCHLVGTASAAAQAGARFPAVLAGMLHAAFDQGIFPNGRSRLSPQHRRYVESRVGEEVTDLVAAYHEFEWGRAAIARLAGSPPTDAPARELLLLRLCNEVDDMVDAGVAIAGKHDPGALRWRVEKCAGLARGLAQERLAQTLEALGEENLAADWASALPTARNSYRVLPPAVGYIRMRGWPRRNRKIHIVGRVPT
jgi:hypothetical protein